MRAFWMLCACGVPLVLAGQAVRELPVDLRIMVEEGPAQPIGELRDFAVAGARTFVLDFKEQVVHVYGSTGVFERSTGRKGSGPGEFRNANGLIAAPDGTVWVNDPGNARLTVLRGDGTFLRHHTFTANMYGYRWEGAFDTQDRLRVSAFNPADAAGGARTVRLDATGRVIDTIAAARPSASPTRSSTIRIDFPNGSRYQSYPFRAPVQAAFDPAGFTWSVRDQDTYELTKADDRGAVISTARRTIPATEIPSSMREAEVRKLEASLKGATRHDADFSRIPRQFAFVSQLTVDEGSRVWARRVLVDSTRTEFDVFGPDGRYLWTARVAVRLAPFARVIIQSGALFGVALDDDDLPSIIRARVPR